ncbi:hypothetical protein EY693_10105 [Enterococcus casseliflavus]|nr:hypothetical protein [Enterococcus casseliflavus]MBO6356675.1 hypothetical protein [Enterococcus casseliflavus]MBO6376684.1 hypothetical protein [Enterococcus casseliflavus]MBO6386043.1 hypothetical protein [Enterococcus casseliflavus]
MLRFHHVESIRPSLYRLLFSFIIARNPKNVLCFVFAALFQTTFYFVIADPVSRLSEAAFFLHYPLFSKHPFK